MNMKNIPSYLLIAATSVMLSCNGFLKEDSGDLMVPTTVNEFQPMLYGEGYPGQFLRYSSWFSLMTDDVEQGYLRPKSGEINTQGHDDYSIGEGRRLYCWDRDIELNNMFKDEFWNDRYDNILACNLVIDAHPNIKYTDAEVGKYNFLAAQAYALRAYNYFCLVNTYAEPYASGNLGKPGVVLRLDPDASTSSMNMSRATLGQVWSQIDSDLAAAERYMAMSETSANKHLFSPQALLLLKTRVALFKGDMQGVIEAGEELLAANPAIFDLNTIDIADMGYRDASQFHIMDLDLNPEIIFTFGGTYQHDYLSLPSAYSFGFRTSYSKRSSLVQAYKNTNHTAYDDTDTSACIDGIDDNETDSEVADLRLRGYLLRNYTDNSGKMAYYYYHPNKYNGGKGSSQNWRNVEALLSVAEAYARTDAGVSTEAIRLLNDLRSKRIRTELFTELTAADFENKEQLIRFVLQERRRELCFEECMRFWDLRRQGCPTLYHRWYESENTYETYILPAGSNNYTLAIPRSETDYNNLASQNPRDVINRE